MSKDLASQIMDRITPKPVPEMPPPEAFGADCGADMGSTSKSKRKKKPSPPAAGGPGGSGGA